LECDIFCAILVALAFLSLSSSTYLVVSLFIGVRESKNNVSPLVMAVFWMSICDIFFSIYAMYNYGPLSPTNNDANQYVCFAMNAMAQFFEVASFCWYFVICVLTFLVLRGYPYASLQKTSNMQHVSVWGFSTMCTLLPIIIHSIDGNTDITACQNSPTPDLFNYFFYIPLLLFITFAIYLLLYTSCMFSGGRGFMGRARKRMLLRMIAFVVVFVGVWIFPLIYKVRGLLQTRQTNTPESKTNFLDIMHDVCVTIAGFANFVVWVTSRSVGVILRDREVPDGEIEDANADSSISGPFINHSGSGQFNRSVAQTSQVERPRSKNRRNDSHFISGARNDSRGDEILPAIASFEDMHGIDQYDQDFFLTPNADPDEYRYVQDL